MIITFNDRDHAARGVEYFARDFRSGPAQEAGLPMPKWFQHPAGLLSLPENPTLDAFRQLLDNISPGSGARLTPRTKTTRQQDGRQIANRRVAYELTISAAKSVSILALCLGDRRILAAYKKAVDDGLQFAARFAAARVRKGGADHDRPTGHLLGLLIHHMETRAGDCQLHTHAVFFNATWDPGEHRFKALQFALILGRKMLIQSWIAARFCHELRQLGYESERVENGFRIVGVPREAEQIQSKRAEAINDAVREAEIKTKKFVGPAGKKIVALNLRENKTPEKWSTMHSRWREELENHWPALEDVVAAAKARPSISVAADHRLVLAAAVLDANLSRLLATHVAIAREALLLAVLREANGDWHGDHAEDAISRRLEDKKYLSLERETITTPADAAAWRAAVLRAYAVKSRAKSLRLPLADVSSPALALIASPDPIAIVATNTSLACKSSTKDFLAQLQALGNPLVYAVPAAVAARGRTMPLSLALTTSPKRILLIGQAEKLTRVELAALVESASSGKSRTLLFASREALDHHDEPTPVAALARHRWMGTFDLSRPKSSAPAGKSRKEFLLASLVDAPTPVPVFADRDIGQAVLGIAARAATFLRHDELATVLTDSSHLAARLNSEIHRQLYATRSEPPTELAIHISRPPSPPRLGDQAVAFDKTRHFGCGECVTIVAITGKGFVVKCVGEAREVKTITRKVWDKLTPVTTAALDVRPGTVLILTASPSGMKGGLRRGETVQVRAVEPSGAIRLTDGRQIPTSFRFFQHGYCAWISESALRRRKSEKRLLLALRKRPRRAIRKAIRALAMAGMLVALSVRSLKHLRSRTALMINLPLRHGLEREKNARGPGSAIQQNAPPSAPRPISEPAALQQPVLSTRKTPQKIKTNGNLEEHHI